ncbi:MAG: class B sortase [Lachnospiraceae bacterium]|nr:class B sortase [Lachnospiraceae bacterium]
MKKTKKIVSAILTIIIVVCIVLAGVLLVYDYLSDRRQESLLSEYREQASQAAESETATDWAQEAEPSDATTSDTDTSDTKHPPAEISTEIADTDKSAPTEETIPEIPRIPNPYADSFLANEDMVAWIQIPGTNVDYPVMWTPRDENYYLYRDFDHSENKNGSLILDTDSCLEPLTTNLIIHGHNMRSGAMFGNLTDYENENFYKEHKYITLYTGECQRNYEVIAVFRSQVYKKSDTVFKFYKFFQADTAEEFEDFYKNIKEMSQYDTGITAEFGDRFLTLSTCVYHVENGRFVVVAKEIEEGDYYEPVVTETDINTP